MAYREFSRHKDHSNLIQSLLFSLFLSFIVLLSAPSVLADTIAEDAIFEGDTFSVRDGGSIDIFDYSMSFVLDADGENIFVDEVNSEHYAIIPLDGCRDIDLLEICFERSSGTTIYATMFTKIPFLSFGTSIASEESLVGETNEFNVTIRNEGRMTSEDTSLNVRLPHSVVVESVHGGEMEDGNVFWEGSIKADEEHELRLELLHTAATDEIEGDSIDAELTYDNMLGIERLQQTQSFSAEHAFLLNLTTEPEELYLGSPFRVILNFTNRLYEDGERNITVNRFIFPLSRLPGMSSPRGFVAETSRNLFWSGRMAYGQSREFSFSLDPSSSGRFDLPLEISFNDTSLEEPRLRRFRYTFPFEVVSRDILINTSIEDGQRFNSSSWYPYNITLTNVDSSLGFSDINVSVAAEGHSENYDIDDLSPGESYILTGPRFLAKPTSSESESSIHVSVSYFNDYGEAKQREATIPYTVGPIQEASLRNEIERIEEGSYRISSYVSNDAGIDIDDIYVRHKLHDDVFFTGSLNGTLESLSPGEEEMVSSYRISSSGLNFSADDYMFKVYLGYSAMDLEKSFTHDKNLTGMVFSLYEDPSVLQRTQETIERYFTSTTVFGIFTVAILLVVASITTVALNKRKFTITGYDSLERKQHSLERKKEKYKQYESKLEYRKQKLEGKIRELKEFMTKTKRLIEKEAPVIEEKKDGLHTRQEELLEEKRLIDQKIEELKEIETRLIKRNGMYERELRELDAREKKLNDHFENVKSRLTMLNKEMDRLLDKEGKIGKQKEELNKKELGLIAEKQRLIKMGTEKFSNEKVDVIQEKIQLQHEKNVLEEELKALGNRKHDIGDAQQAIHKQKADLEKEKNIFDMNKEAVESSLKVLREQSEKINDILSESRESYIESQENEDAKTQSDGSDKQKKKESKKGKKKQKNN